jgi:predicted dehydrogenase
MVSQNYRFHSWVRTLRYLVESREFGRADNLLVHFAKAPRFEGSFRLEMDHPLVRDMSIHHFDLMRAVTGQEPISVYAETWRPKWSWFRDDPCAVTIFQFTGNLKAVYHGSWVARGRETTWNGHWTVECAEGVLELVDNQVHIRAPELPHHDTTVELHRMPCESLEFSLLEFQKAIAEGRPPESNGRDNLNSLAMVFATTRSAALGEPVRIEDIRGTA